MTSLSAGNSELSILLIFVEILVEKVEEKKILKTVKQARIESMWDKKRRICLLWASEALQNRI